jgi:hypothetical protein
MTSLDSLFDIAGRKDVVGLSRETLLHTEFTTSDPEGLDGVSEIVPDLGVPEVEFRYNMSGRGEMVRCVYCKYPNHFDGFVVKYSNGTRNLVGRDCAVSHHGVDLERHLNEFESNIERQGYARRTEYLKKTAALVRKAFEDLKEHPAISEHDRVLARFRYDLGDLSKACVAAAWSNRPLVVERIVRDEEGERRRKKELGWRFQQVRDEAKTKGETWQLFKSERQDFGVLAGVPFFRNGVSISKRLWEIEGELTEGIRALVQGDLTTRQMQAAFRRLSDVREEIEKEFARMEALEEAFSPESLARIAGWANALQREQDRRDAAQYGMPVRDVRDLYAAEGNAIWSEDARVAMVSVYRAPSRVLIEVLKEATSAEHQP